MVAQARNSNPETETEKVISNCNLGDIMKEKQNRIGRMLTLIRKVSKQANRILISNRKESNYSRNMCSNLISSSDNNRSTVLQVLRPVAATDNFKSIDEMRPKLLHICRDYLFGDWKSMPLKSYGFQHVR